MAIRQRRGTGAPMMTDEQKKTMQRSWNAVNRFNRMVPTLNKFVRALTGNQKAVVKPTAGDTCTDGQIIYIRPPIRLGDDIPHVRIHCERRGPDRRQMCPACDIHENVMGSIYHEMAHVIFGTMVRPSRTWMDTMRQMIDEWHPKDACEHAHELKNYLFTDGSETYLSSANTFSPILKSLINGLEDARVNASMFRVRPGTRAMMDANLVDIMTHGVYGEGAEADRWQDRPVDIQMIVSVFLAASEYYEPLAEMHPEVQEILDLPVVRALVGMAAVAEDAEAVALVARDLFLVFQEHGVMVVPKCQKVEPTEDPDSGVKDDPEFEPELGEAANGQPGDSATAPSQGGSGSEQSGSSGSANSQASDSEASDPSGSSESDEESSGDNPASGDSETGPEPDEGDEADSGGDGDADDSESGDATSEGMADGARGDDESAAGDGLEESDEDGEGIDGTRDGSGEPTPDATDLHGDVEDGHQESGDISSEEDESDSPIPADHSPVTPEEIDHALRRVSLHAMLEPDLNREEFATGESDLHKAIELLDSLSDDELTMLASAVGQAWYFDTMSANVSGVIERTFPCEGLNWTSGRDAIENYMPAATTLNQCISEARLAFEENQRRRFLGNLKAGRVDGRKLARRIPADDPRMMRKKIVPGKRDYHVVIGIDVSGSTGGYQRLERIKRAVVAQAQVLDKTPGITFEIWAHSAGYDIEWNKRGAVVKYDVDGGMKLWMNKIKGPDEPWGSVQKERLACIDSQHDNIDGHTLEFYRKKLDAVRATDRIIIYYTDGAMPAANAYEEQEILEREIVECRKRKYALVAVGINTDSPVRFGFDTVRVDSDNDLVSVVRQLKKHLTS